MPNGHEEKRSESTPETEKVKAHVREHCIAGEGFLNENPPNHDMALAQFQEALKLDPQDPEARYGRARILLWKAKNLGGLDNSWPALLKMLSDYAVAANNKTFLESPLTKDFEESYAEGLSTYAVLAGKGRYPVDHDNALHAYSTAMEYFKEALKKNSKNVEILIKRDTTAEQFLALLRKKKTTNTLNQKYYKQIREIAKFKDSAEIAFNLAHAALEKEQALIAVTRLAPKTYWDWYYQGTAFELLGQEKDALRCYQNAAKLKDTLKDEKDVTPYAISALSSPRYKIMIPLFTYGGGAVVAGFFMGLGLFLAGTLSMVWLGGLPAIGLLVGAAFYYIHKKIDEQLYKGPKPVAILGSRSSRLINGARSFSIPAMFGLVLGLLAAIGGGGIGFAAGIGVCCLIGIAMAAYGEYKRYSNYKYHLAYSPFHTLKPGEKPREIELMTIKPRSQDAAPAPKQTSAETPPQETKSPDISPQTPQQTKR